MRDVEIARLVARSVKNGRQIKDGIFLAMETFGVSQRTADRAWAKHGNVWIIKPR